MWVEGGNEEGKEKERSLNFGDGGVGRRKSKKLGRRQTVEGTNGAQLAQSGRVKARSSPARCGVPRMAGEFLVGKEPPEQPTAGIHSQKNQGPAREKWERAASHASGPMDARRRSREGAWYLSALSRSQRVPDRSKGGLAVVMCPPRPAPLANTPRIDRGGWMHRRSRVGRQAKGAKFSNVKCQALAVHYTYRACMACNYYYVRITEAQKVPRGALA